MASITCQSLRVALRGCWPFLFLLGALARPAYAQDEENNISPRAALRSFLEAARSGHYEKASKAVFPPTGAGPGFANPAVTARELEAVLDTYLLVDLTKIPDASDGHTADHVAADVVEIGHIPSQSERSDSIRLMKLGGIGWVFSPATLNRVPGWYDQLPDRWIRDRLPDLLLRAGPREVLWWQWLAMPLLLLLSFVLGRLLALAVTLVLRLISKRLPRTFDNAFLRRLVGPFTLIVTAIVATELARLLIHTAPAQKFIGQLEAAVTLSALFWGALRAVDWCIEALRGASFAKGRPERVALLPLFSKAAKIGLTIIAGVEVLQNLGYPAASLIAGLGIGGLAVALAAQKTVENLLGSVVIGIDQPFRPGETVKVDDLIGIVESVGLRSTRIRTGHRTIVTIPNGRLSDMRIETFAERDRILMNFRFALAFTTTAETARRLVTDIKSYLDGQPSIHPGSGQVFWTGLASGLELEVTASIGTTDLLEFQTVRQECLLQIMQLVAAGGSTFTIRSPIPA